MGCGNMIYAFLIINKKNSRIEKIEIRKSTMYRPSSFDEFKEKHKDFNERYEEKTLPVIGKPEKRRVYIIKRFKEIVAVVGSIDKVGNVSNNIRRCYCDEYLMLEIYAQDF